VSLKQAGDEPFIVLQPDFGLRRLAEDLWRKAGIQPQIAFESTEILSMEGLVAAGFGVAIVPSPRPNRAEPEVAYVPLRDGAAHRVIGLVWPKALPLSPVAAQFAKFVRWLELTADKFEHVRFGNPAVVRGDCGVHAHGAAAELRRGPVPQDTSRTPTGALPTAGDDTSSPAMVPRA
jgi:hypothetical protein